MKSNSRHQQEIERKMHQRLNHIANSLLSIIELIVTKSNMEHKSVKEMQPHIREVPKTRLVRGENFFSQEVTSWE